MFESEKKNITTKLFEGILYPIPNIIPDPANTSKSSDSGEVWFDTNRLDLDDYALMGGGINVRTAFGVTEDHFYQSAREHLFEIYQTEDIQLGGLRFLTTTECKRIVIPYSVNL